MAAKLKQIGLKEIKCDFNYQNYGPEVMERQRHDNSEHKVMLKILDRLSDKDENQNISLNQTEDVIKEIESDSSLDVSQDVVNQVSKNERLIRTLIDIVSENNATKKEYKVTEVNATAGILADDVEPYLVNAQIVPTDIDYKLFVRSVDNVSDAMKDKAKQWDVKDVPQLLASDVIVYRDSLDVWHLNTDDLIKQFNEAIAENGFLILVAKYRLTEPEEAIYSLMHNNNTTNTELEKRCQSLFEAITKSDLRLIASKSDSVSTMAMMFRKVTEKRKIPEKDEVIGVTGERNEKWFETVRESLQKFKEVTDAGEKPSPVWLIANDTHINGIVGLVNCLRKEPGGENFRCLFDMDSKIKLPIDWTTKPFSDILTNDLVINIIRDGRIGTYRHLRLPKDYDKTVSNEYFLNQGTSKDLSSMAWFDLRNLTPSDNPHDFLGNPIKLLPVKIYSSGLIFKDVMFATGM